MSEFLIRLFVRDYQDVKRFDVRKRYGMLGGVTGVICNVLLFAVKLAVGLVTSSVAVMADAFNNLSDVGSSVVTIAGFKLASKAPDKKHPFGYGRIEYIAGLIISLIIIMLGVEFIRTSVDRILHPEPVVYSTWSLIVLVISVLVKLWMAVFSRTLAKAIESPAISAASFDSISDVCATSAVIVSLVFSSVTAFPVDGIIGIVVALFIIFSGISIARDTLSPLLGQTPDPEMVKEIENRVLSYEDITGVHDLIIHNYGPGRCIASIHAEVPADHDFIGAHEHIDLAEREISEQMNIMLVIHLDPIAVNDQRVDKIHAVALSVLHDIDPCLTLHDFRLVDGENRINVIFDVVVPHGYRLSNDALRLLIDRGLKSHDARLFSVINIDNSFVGE